MQTFTIAAWDDFVNLQKYVEENKFEFVFLDTETNNKREILAQLWGVGLSFQDEEAFYIPFRTPTAEHVWTNVQEHQIAQWICDQAYYKKLVGHNIIYDVLVLWYNWGIDLTEYIYSDTILQKHMVDEERPFGLKETAVKYLGAWADKAQDALHENIKANGGSVTKDNLEMWKADTAVLSEYCCYDVILTQKLFHLFESQIEEQNLTALFYADEIMPLYKEVTIPMRKRGFPVDVAYFEKLKEDITVEITKQEISVLEQLKLLIEDYIRIKLNKEVPIKPSGKFAQAYAKLIDFELPVSKTGKPTFAKKAIDALYCQEDTMDQKRFVLWLQGKENPCEWLSAKAQMNVWDENNEHGLFNLNSTADLKWLFFNKLECKPLGKTPGGEPQVDDDFLESVQNEHPWVGTLLDYKRLNKLKSTYIEGILERQVDGVIYAGFLQFGTTSGRYSCTDPNLTNLPRVKDDDSNISPLVLTYVNSIKRGFVPPDGSMIVDSDYSQLEPRAFAEACGDKKLQDVFNNKEDLYGSIAVNVFRLKCTANEVKKLHPEMRQKAKIFALAVVYGAEAGRISKSMNIGFKEAQRIIDDYLNAYPGLKKYMSDCHVKLCTQGFVESKFGRKRRLPAGKFLYDKYKQDIFNKTTCKNNGFEQEFWKFKNYLNLSKNHPIQSVAAHVVNRAMIATQREFKRQGIDGGIVAMIHDQITCVAKKSQAEQARNILRDCMQNTTKLSVPLVAEPKIADNWAESK